MEETKKKPSSEIGNLYKQFIHYFVENYFLKHTDKPGRNETAYKLGQEEWSHLRFEGKEEVVARINELKIAFERKRTQNLEKYFKVPAARLQEKREGTVQATLVTGEAKNSEKNEEEEELRILEEDRESSDSVSSSSSRSSSSCSSVSPLVSKLKPTPKQDQLNVEINQLNEEISGYVTFKKVRTLTREEACKLESLSKRKIQKGKELKRLLKCNEANKRHRTSQKRQFEKLKADNPELSEKLAKFTRNKPGRPRKEDDYPDLQNTILKLVVNESSADSRRQSERINSCSTLDELTEALNDLGFHMSRSAVYLRLLPKRSLSAEGQRHISTVPVRLLRAENMHRKHHPDGHFATATVKYIKELAGLLGGDMVFYLSQDDKARIPLGLPAANKQSHVLMHLQYRITLPDHDWVVAAQHKLIAQHKFMLNTNCEM